jgi:hypothetical protein
MATMRKPLDEAMRAMDTQNVDGDGRVRLGGTQARAEGVFLSSLFSGTFGVVLGVVCVAAMAAPLFWLFV